MKTIAAVLLTALSFLLFSQSKALAFENLVEGDTCKIFFEGMTDDLRKWEVESKLFSDKNYQVVDQLEDAEFVLRLYGGLQQQTWIQQIQYRAGWSFGNGLNRLAHWSQKHLVRDSSFYFELHHLPSESEIVSYEAGTTYARFYTKIERKLNSKIPTCRRLHGR